MMRLVLWTLARLLARFSHVTSRVTLRVRYWYVVVVHS